MAQLAYTSIPDTPDSGYWEMKTQNTLERRSIFVPWDKDLLQKLTTWQDIQAKLPEMAI